MASRGGPVPLGISTPQSSLYNSKSSMTALPRANDAQTNYPSSYPSKVSPLSRKSGIPTSSAQNSHASAEYLPRGSIDVQRSGSEITRSASNGSNISPALMHHNEIATRANGQLVIPRTLPSAPGINVKKDIGTSSNSADDLKRSLQTGYTQHLSGQAPDRKPTPGNLSQAAMEAKARLLAGKAKSANASPNIAAPPSQASEKRQSPSQSLYQKSLEENGGSRQAGQKSDVDELITQVKAGVNSNPVGHPPTLDGSNTTNDHRSAIDADGSNGSRNGAVGTSMTAAARESPASNLRGAQFNTAQQTHTESTEKRIPGLIRQASNGRDGTMIDRPLAPNGQNTSGSRPVSYRLTTEHDLGGSSGNPNEYRDTVRSSVNFAKPSLPLKSPEFNRGNQLPGGLDRKDVDRPYPKYSSADDAISHWAANGKTTTSDTLQTTEADFAREQTLAELPNVREWLKLTGYFDAEYRDNTLKLQREMAELDARKAELALRAQKANEQRLLRGGSTVPVSFSAGMAPSQSPSEEVENEGLKSGGTTWKSEARSPASERKTEPMQLDPVRKRTNSTRGEDASHESSTSKYSRGEGGRQNIPTETSYQKPSGSYKHGNIGFGARDSKNNTRQDQGDNRYNKTGFSDRQEGFKPRNLGDSSERFSRNKPVSDNRYGNDRSASYVEKRNTEDPRDGDGEGFTRRMRSSEMGRNRSPPAGGSKFSPPRSKWQLELKNQTPSSTQQRSIGGYRVGPPRKLASYGRQFDSRELALYKPGSQFFMIKSFVDTNVRVSQSEGLWMTQTKNEGILERAFRKSRNVILIFSVNQSKAFQGYARMESAPGEDEKPSWSKDMNWGHSGGFRIRWVTIAVTRFGRVGHLKNDFNEDEPVIVGRDGQEIDPRCGAKLCELIDDTADFQTQTKPH